MYSPSVFPLSLKNPWLPTPLLAFPAHLMVIPCHLHLVIEGETAIGSFVALKTVNGISRRIAVLWQRGYFVGAFGLPRKLTTKKKKDELNDKWVMPNLQPFLTKKKEIIIKMLCIITF